MKRIAVWMEGLLSLLGNFEGSGWKIKVERKNEMNKKVKFKDLIRGEVEFDAGLLGDVVIAKDMDTPLYHFAVVVDDFEQGITQIVRGADLLDSTPRQIYLQQLFGFPTPQYAHIPVASNAAGEKLSKQTLAPAIDATQASSSLTEALNFLGQQPPKDLSEHTPSDILEWAKQHWDISKILGQRSIVF